MKQKSFPRRLAALCAAAGMLAAAVPLPAGAAQSGSGAVSLNANVEREPYFSEVFAAYPSGAGGGTVSVPAGGAEGTPLTWTAGQESLSWEFEVPSDGQYVLSVDYRLLGSSGADGVRSLLLDGESPFFEADYLVFPRSWRDEGEVRVNSLGDEVRPQTVENTGWQTTVLTDGHGFYSTPLVFYLTQGTHTFTLSYVKEDMELGTWHLLPYQAPAPYEAPAGNAGAQGKELTFQAEDSIQSKNNASIQMETDDDPSAEPFSYGYRLLNAVGGWQWRTGGQAVTFSFTVPEDGYYQIALRYAQKWNDGMPAYRSISIDGEIPCAELSAYRFTYGDSWQTEILGDDERAFQFWLEEGEHTLTLRAVMGELTPIIQSVYDDMLVISDLMKEINQLTGSDPDPNYDYKFFTYIPTLEGDLRGLSERLKQKSEALEAITAKSTSMSSNLRSIAAQLDGMIADPFSIAKRADQLTQAQTNLGSWYSEMQTQPLLLDEFTVYTPDEEPEVRQSSFFEKLWASVYNFWLSFFKDYNNMASVLEGDVEITETLDVWIARGTEWAETVKMLADQSFTPTSGIAVNLNIVPASQLNTGSSNALLLAITAGNAPDVAMGVAANSPVEFAIRDAVVDLSQFDTYDEVRSRSLDKIWIPFEYSGGVYAVPETMSFTALFYRKDLFEELGLTLPDTWEELYDTLLPALFQNGMKFYQTQDFTPFLFQYGGAFYNEDGTASALDTPEAFQAFRAYTEMFTNYGSPVSANFLTRFRTGEMPIGIGNFSFYVQLLTAAPELVGRWGMACLPGVKKENGEIDRSSGGLAAECDILLAQSSKQQAAWEFLDWWTRADTQRDYARELEARIGIEARWNSANLEVFQTLDWEREDLAVLQEQWKWATETPVVLGGYYTTRYINNAFNSVVVSGDKTVRDALEDAVKEINRELKMKQEEYGVFVDET